MTEKTILQILQIEKEVRELYATEQYRRTFQDMLDIELQNKWLRTQDGKYEIGADRAKEIIQKNVDTLKVFRSKLAFLAKEIHGKRNQSQISREADSQEEAE